MVCTANCDIYAAVHEKGINDQSQVMMLELPSSFNIGSSAESSNPEPTCNAIDAALTPS
jgi:hypothetical protein